MFLHDVPEELVVEKTGLFSCPVIFILRYLIVEGAK